MQPAERFGSRSLPGHDPATPQRSAATWLHDLSEALTAIGSYVLGVQILLSKPDTFTQEEKDKLAAAAESLSAQIRRAEQDVHHLRAILRGASADHPDP